MSNAKTAYKPQSTNKIIVVDGIIGAGKTTLCSYLSERYRLKFYKEMVDEEKNTLTQDMLDLFYKTPKRWGAMTQVMFLSHRFQDLQSAQKQDEFCLFDRSIYGDEIFAYNLYKRQEMTRQEFDIYKGLLKPMLAAIALPRVLIYLDVTVDVAMARIAQRSRSTEASLISRTYMEDLKTAYDAWFDGFDLCKKVKLDFNAEGMTMANLKALDQCMEGVVEVE